MLCQGVGVKQTICAFGRGGLPLATRLRSVLDDASGYERIENNLQETVAWGSCHQTAFGDGLTSEGAEATLYAE
jgi:hypothetical protein